MKKIMIVFAVIALAGVTQAASFKWASTTGQYMYQAGTTTKMAAGTLYLFNADNFSQSAFLDAFAAGTDIASMSSLASTSMKSSGTFSQTSDIASIGADQTLNAYFAIVDGDNVYVSATKSGLGQSSATTPMNFSGLSSSSRAAATEWTVGSSFSAGGWYTAVPEPTSGLLMLVGLAGLALRRRRA